MNYNVYICISIYNGFTSNRSMAPRWMPSSSASMEPPKASSWPPSRCWITWRSKRRWDRGPHGFTQHQKIVTFPAVKIGIWLKIGSQNGGLTCQHGENLGLHRPAIFSQLGFNESWRFIPKMEEGWNQALFFCFTKMLFWGVEVDPECKPKIWEFPCFFPMLQHMFDDCFPMLFRVFKHFV